MFILLITKPTRCTNFSNLFSEQNSTCFGQFLCPSSGVFHCTHSNGICHTGLLTAWEQDQDGTGLVLLQLNRKYSKCIQAVRCCPTECSFSSTLTGFSDRTCSECWTDSGEWCFHCQLPRSSTARLLNSDICLSLCALYILVFLYYVLFCFFLLPIHFGFQM